MPIKRSEIEFQDCPICHKMSPAVWHAMEDDHFLGYCNLHSRTERALFSPDHVNRLFDLAGDERAGRCEMWVSMGPDFVDPLVDAAMGRLKSNPSKVVDMDFGCECGHRWSEYVVEG